MPVFRKVCKKNYTVLDNEILNDLDMDWKSLGLLVYLLSKPETWNVSIAQLTKLRSDGRYSITKAINALISLGYIERFKLGNGTVQYNVYAEKRTGEKSYPQPKIRKPDSGSVPKVQKPDSGCHPKSKNLIQEGTQNQVFAQCKNPQSKNQHLVNKEYLVSNDLLKNAREEKSSPGKTVGDWIEGLKESIRS